MPCKILPSQTILSCISGRRRSQKDAWSSSLSWPVRLLCAKDTNEFLRSSSFLLLHSLTICSSFQFLSSLPNSSRLLCLGLLTIVCSHIPHLVRRTPYLCTPSHSVPGSPLPRRGMRKGIAQSLCFVFKARVCTRTPSLSPLQKAAHLPRPSSS